MAPINVLILCKIYTNFLVVKALLDVSAIVGQIQEDNDNTFTVLLNMANKLPKHIERLLCKDN